jgi:hypothetical protein
MLYEELSKKFGCQVVEPFKEPVLIVDSKEFKPQWEEQLRAEGCKILVSDYLGKSCFLIRKPQPSNNSPGSNPSLEQTQIEEKPNVEEGIIQLIREGKNFKEIRQTLGLTHTQLMGRLSGLRKKGVLNELNWISKRRLKKLSTQEPKLHPTQKVPQNFAEAKPSLSASNLDVKELLQVSLKILDEHPRIAKFLLQKCMESLT